MPTIVSDGTCRSSITIEHAQSPKDIETIKLLFTEYIAWLDLDLTFQDYASEFASLPGKYAPPTGCLLLARPATPTLTPTTTINNDTALGCVALRPLGPVSPRCCEMKRLYVLPAARGSGAGKALVAGAVAEARRLGYGTVKLDTLPGRMAAAVRMYEGLGFRRCERYYETPLEGTVFMELDLGA
ncbi:hypothetical protein MBLNU459_g7853t1 [Dothideomycetes sp. NU459]